MDPRPHITKMEVTEYEWSMADVGLDMKIAHAAEGLGLDIEYHSCNPATRHLMAATRNSNYYEIVWVHPEIPVSAAPIYADEYEDGLHSVDAAGCVSVPDGPGLGVTYDWDWINHYQVGYRSYGE